MLLYNNVAKLRLDYGANTQDVLIAERRHGPSALAGHLPDQRDHLGGVQRLAVGAVGHITECVEAEFDR